MRFAKIRSMDISNGEGIGVALFVQGCHFHCKNCFNESTWDFSGGEIWTSEVENKFMELVSNPYIVRVSILGGEPLASENVRKVYLIAKRVREEYPDKKVWIYTGYNYESISNISSNSKLAIDQADKYRMSLIRDYCDILVDGQYIDEKKDYHYKYAGSTNQRIIDINETIKNSKLTLYKFKSY